MPRLSEELFSAVSSVNSVPSGYGGFIVKFCNLTHEEFPGRDAHATLPLLVTGHEELSAAAWRSWILENAVGAYGASYAAQLASYGVDLKDMMPTGQVGRRVRLVAKALPSGQTVTEYRDFREINMAGAIIEMVEKWPSLYNMLAKELRGTEMPLRDLVEHIRNLPCPFEIGRGRYLTLGDLIGRGMTQTPSY